jgi:hypothetical protein
VAGCDARSPSALAIVMQKQTAGTMKPLHLVRFFTVALVLAGTLPSFAQTLTVTGDLQLWLKADAGITTNAAGAVIQWADQSGNTNNALQAADTQAPLLVNAALNSKPVLRFDGVDDFLDVADSDSLSGAGDMASFFVVKFDDFANYRGVWGKTAGPNNNLPAPTDVYAVINDGRLQVYRGDANLNASPALSAQPLRAATYLVLGFDVAGETLTHYLNNQANGSAIVTTNTADANTPLKIGTRNDFVTKLKGDLAELLIYNRALSITERSNVFNYLQTKYNLLNLAPSITLSATPSGPNANSGDVVTLNANPVDLDGTIARVEFFANGVLFGTATQAPYTLRATLDSVGAVQFTARAVDNKDASATSSAVSFTVSGAGPTELPVTGGLQLWVKADVGVTTSPAGNVLQWLDQSGAGNNAVQLDETKAPVLTNNAVNGRPALRFDGTDDYLDVPDSDSISITGDITSIFVTKFTDFGTFRAVWGKTAGNLPAPTDFYALPTTGLPRMFRGNATSAGAQSVTGSRAFTAGSFLLAGFDQAGTTATHYLSGFPNGSGTITVAPTDANTALKIGSRSDFATKLKGELAELLIFNRALPAAERRAVERYLSEKYGFAAALVSVSNNVPAVAVTGPIGQVLQAPGTFTLSAEASDADGTVQSVQFFVDGVSVGTDSTAPYSTNFTLRYGGTVTLTAVATDNLGARRTSTPVQIRVQGPGVPLGLISYWPLDGNATAVVGTSGTLVNGAAAVIDRNFNDGAALFFDGALRQRVEVPGGGGLSGARRGTISMWVKWTGTQDTGFSGNAGAVLGRQLDGTFSSDIINLKNANPDLAVVQWRQTAAGTITAEGTSVVGNDFWRHIAVTFTETNSQLFVDGSLEGTGGGGALQSNATTPLAIGAWTGGGDSYCTATIDDVAIWNRILSAEEIQLLATDQRTPMTLLIAPDSLTVERSGSDVVLRWSSGTVLQYATEASGPYTDIADVTSPYRVSADGDAWFYRLRSP